MPRAVRSSLLPLLAAVAASAGASLYRDSPARNRRPTGEPADRARPKPAGKLVVLVVFDQMRGDYLALGRRSSARTGSSGMKKRRRLVQRVPHPLRLHLHRAGARVARHRRAAVGPRDRRERVVRPQGRGARLLLPAEAAVRPRPAAAGRTRQARPRVGTGFSPGAPARRDRRRPLQAATGGKGRVVQPVDQGPHAVLMGGQKPTAVYCFDTRDGVFHTGAYYRDTPHPWVDGVQRGRGSSNTWFDKKWTRFRPDLDYEKSAARTTRPARARARTGRARLPAPARAASSTPRRRRTTPPSRRRRSATSCCFELAKKASRRRSSGAATAPDLLCVSFSSNDLDRPPRGARTRRRCSTSRSAPTSSIADLLDVPRRDGRQGPLHARAHRRPRRLPAAGAEASSRPGASGVPLDERTAAELAAALDDDVRPVARRADALVRARTATRTTVAVGVPEPHGDPGPRARPATTVADYAAQWLGNRPFMLTAFTRKQIETNTLPPATRREQEVRASFERVKLAYHPDRCGDVIVVPKPGVLVRTTRRARATAARTPTTRTSRSWCTGRACRRSASGRSGCRRWSSRRSLAWALGIDPPAGDGWRNGCRCEVHAEARMTRMAQ